MTEKAHVPSSFIGWAEMQGVGQRKKDMDSEGGKEVVRICVFGDCMFWV